MKIAEKRPTMEQFDRIVNRWKEQLIQCQTDTNELVFRLRDFVQTEVDINRIKSNRWIPCSERLPDMPVEGLDAEYSDCCLVCDAHDWIGMAYCLTDGKKTWWEFADAQNKVKIDWTEVTHWMPLPEPPKGEQK